MEERRQKSHGVRAVSGATAKDETQWIRQTGVWTF